MGENAVNNSSVNAGDAVSTLCIQIDVWLYLAVIKLYFYKGGLRGIRRHALRWFAALAGAFRLASACASVLAKSINPRAYINVGKS